MEISSEAHKRFQYLRQPISINPHHQNSQKNLFQSYQSPHQNYWVKRSQSPHISQIPYPSHSFQMGYSSQIQHIDNTNPLKAQPENNKINDYCYNNQKWKQQHQIVLSPQQRNSYPEHLVRHQTQSKIYPYKIPISSKQYPLKISNTQYDTNNNQFRLNGYICNTNQQQLSKTPQNKQIISKNQAKTATTITQSKLQTMKLLKLKGSTPILGKTQPIEASLKGATSLKSLAETNHYQKQRASAHGIMLPLWEKSQMQIQKEKRTQNYKGLIPTVDSVGMNSFPMKGSVKFTQMKELDYKQRSKTTVGLQNFIDLQNIYNKKKNINFLEQTNKINTSPLGDTYGKNNKNIKDSFQGAIIINTVTKEVAQKPAKTQPQMFFSSLINRKSLKAAKCSILHQFSAYYNPKSNLLAQEPQGIQCCWHSGLSTHHSNTLNQSAVEEKYPQSSKSCLGNTKTANISSQSKSAKQNASKPLVQPFNTLQIPRYLQEQRSRQLFNVQLFKRQVGEIINTQSIILPKKCQQKPEDKERKWKPQLNRLISESTHNLKESIHEPGGQSQIINQQNQFQFSLLGSLGKQIVKSIIDKYVGH